MSRRPLGAKSQARRAKKEQAAQAEYSSYLREAGRRPGRGTGTSGKDLWHPDTHRSEAESVDDPRRNQTRCRRCDALVNLVEINGKWQARNDDGLPHMLTCKGIDDD